MIKNDNGTYSLYNRLSGYALDVKGGQPSEGCTVAQYYYNGSGSQQWNLIKSARLAGDVNDDGKVELTDVILFKQSIAGWKVTLK